MDYYLSFNNNEERIRLPVIPSSFEVSIPHQNTTVNINELGEINLIGKTGLMSMTIVSFSLISNIISASIMSFKNLTSILSNFSNGKTQVNQLESL